MMKPDEIKARFEKALAAFMGEQSQLLALDVNERAVGAVLAHLYVREVFPDHNVDAEYNRVGLGGLPKRLDLPPECGRPKGRVYPDIIVHLRGHNDENLLVAELKMARNLQPRNCDHIKLQAFVDQLGYRVGVFVDLPVGEDAGDRVPDIRWFGV
jgi:hypothetical protein